MEDNDMQISENCKEILKSLSAIETIERLKDQEEEIKKINIVEFVEEVAEVDNMSKLEIRKCLEELEKNGLIEFHTKMPNNAPISLTITAKGLKYIDKLHKMDPNDTV